jgi:hypothetical protein
MLPKPKRVKKAVTLITDANPSFVSLVGHGANQTPFRVVKIADLTEHDQPMSKNNNTQKAGEVTQDAPIPKGKQPQSSDVVPGTAGEATPDLHKFIFAGESYPTVESVEKFLKDDGYENFTVEKIDGDEGSFGWVVKSIDEDAFEKIEAIQRAEGVTMFVGTLKAASKPGAKKAPGINEAASGAGTGSIADAGGIPNSTPDNTTGATDGVPSADKEKKKGKNKAKKIESAELAAVFAPMIPVTGEQASAKKIDSYCAYLGRGGGVSIEEILEDAADGFPIGFSDVSSAFQGALKNLVLAKQVDKLPELMTEYGNILATLIKLTTSLEEEEQFATASKKMFGEVPATETTKKQGKTEEGQVAVEKTVGQPSEVETAIAKALAPFQTALESIQADMVKKTDLDPLSERVEKVASRVTTIEAARVTRKSVSATDAASPAAGTATQEETPVGVRKVDDMTASTLGVRNSAKSLQSGFRKA